MPAVEPEAKPNVDDTLNEMTETVQRIREDARRGRALAARVASLTRELADVQSQYDDWQMRQAKRQESLEKIAALATTLTDQLVEDGTEEKK